MDTYSNRLSCRSSRSWYYDLLDEDTARWVPQDVHEHVNSCDDCKAGIRRLEEMLSSRGKTIDIEQRRKDAMIIELLSLHFAWMGEPVACADAKPFIPSLADPLLQIRVPTPITVHLANCLACAEELTTLKESGLGHVQLCQLSRILSGDPGADLDDREIRAAFPRITHMLERPDSGIATRFTFHEIEESRPGRIRPLPQIDVEVVEARERRPVRERPAATLKLKPYIKVAIAAAAVVLIGSALLLRTPPAKAVDLERIYNAIKGADNIHVAHFRPGNTKATQEEWVSRSRGLYMSISGTRFVLWDIRSGVKKSKETFDAETETENLIEASTGAIKERINGTLGIVPFANVSDVPADAKWNKVAYRDLGPEVQGSEVYDLTWIEVSNSLGEPVHMRWRCFTEPASGLPRRVQSYRASSADVEYVLQMDAVVEHLGDGEIDAAIEEASF